MDWSKRPLPEPMLNYAVLDTCYLIPLMNNLKKELRAKGILFCVEEECEILSNVRPAPPNNEPLFLRFKGAKKLDSLSLAVLEGILQLRKKIAIEIDRPPFRIMGNQAILEIVEKKPSSMRELKKIKGIGQKNQYNLGDAILKRIKEATALSEKDHPKIPTKTKKTINPLVRKRIKILKRWRDQQAVEMDIASSLIFTNAQISSLAAANPHDPDQMDAIPEIRKWQKKIFGEKACSILKSID
jgi:ribonuclease D